MIVDDINSPVNTLGTKDTKKNGMNPNHKQTIEKLK